MTLLAILFSISLFVFCLLFVTWLGDKKYRGTGVHRAPWLYAVSVAVYCTSWTFYGSIGAASSGINTYLIIGLGPTIAAPLWWVMLKKKVILTKKYNLNSQADFVSARYGKSRILGALVALVLLFATVPYITLQIQSITNTFSLLLPTDIEKDASWISHLALYVTALLALFTIIFGTRSLDSSEKNEGIVSMVVFESILKIIVFLLMGFLIIFYIFDGPKDLFLQARGLEDFSRIFTVGTSPVDWFFLLLVSSLAFMFLPHVYQTSVIENTQLDNVDKVIWIFPLYLFVINIFVTPIAIAGKIYFANNPAISPDIYLLQFPIEAGMPYLSILVFLAGLGAGVGMCVMACVSLSTMISNNVIMPIFLQFSFFGIKRKRNLSKSILAFRRIAIIFIFFSAWHFYFTVGIHMSLASIGLIAFVAVSQLAPTVIGGLFWHKGTKWGALLGLSGGMLVWAYTLAIPTLADAGYISKDFLTNGPFNLAMLRPYNLFGVSDLTNISNSAFWSLSVNVLLYFLGSKYFPKTALEQHQAKIFVGVLDQNENTPSLALKVSVKFSDIFDLLEKYLGDELALKSLKRWFDENNLDFKGAETDYKPTPSFVEFAESQVAGVIGVASARIIVKTMVKEEELAYDDFVNILEESSAIKKYATELEKTTKDLQESLSVIEKLKRHQDGDYFLTSLLIDSLASSHVVAPEVKVDFLVEQKKKFNFKKKDYELGGDINITENIELSGRPYTLVANADGMGKSIQGAGGAIVFGVVLKALVNRSKQENDRTTVNEWLRGCYREMQEVFLSFHGSMNISAVVGLLENNSGEFTFINAEHPWCVSYKDGKARYIEKELSLHRFGFEFNPPSEQIMIQNIKIEKNEVIIMGSDGRDDVLIDDNGSQVMNSDEQRFLKCVEKSSGDLELIKEEVLCDAELTDDLSMLSLKYEGKDDGIYSNILV